MHDAYRVNCGLALALEHTGDLYSCDHFVACHGGCPEDRFAATPDGEPGLNYLCPGYKVFFHHVDVPMRAMGELLRRGRAPAEIMRSYATEDARRSRNDPCTCGSGRRWKRCHGAPGGAAGSPST